MTRVPSQPFSELLPETGSSENKYSMKSILLPDSREQGQQNLQHAASFGQILHFHSQSSNFVKPPTNTRDKILDKLMETKEKLNSTPAYSVIGQQGVAKQHPYLQPPSPLIANSKVMPSQISRPTHEAQDLPSEFRPSFHSKLADLLASKNSSSQIFKKAQPEDPSSPSAQQEPHQSLLFSTKQSSAVAQSQSQALIPKSSSASIHSGATFFAKILHQEYLKYTHAGAHSQFALFIEDTKDQLVILSLIKPRILRSELIGSISCPLSTKSRLIFIDLDETLVRTELEDPYRRYDNLITVKGKQGMEKIGVWHRPGLKSFLERANKAFDLAIFTAASQTYADTIIKGFDPEHRYFKFRLYRQHCNQIGGKLSLNRILCQAS